MAKTKFRLLHNVAKLIFISDKQTLVCAYVNNIVNDNLYYVLSTLFLDKPDS
jgi:hypothetical protein